MPGTADALALGDPPAGGRGHDDLFRSGAYVDCFKPEDRRNPFATLYARKRDAVVAAVPGRDRCILDVGGGPGRMSLPLSERHRVVLCDLSRDMLLMARADPDGRLARCCADAAALPFKEGSFDVLLCIDVLPHLRDPGAVLARCRPLLRSGGRLVVDSTNAIPLWTLAYPRYIGRRPGRWVRAWLAGGVLPEWSARVRHYRRSEFLALVTGAGFRVVEERRFGAGPLTKCHMVTAVPS